MARSVKPKKKTGNKVTKKPAKATDKRKVKAGSVKAEAAQVEPAEIIEQELPGVNGRPTIYTEAIGEEICNRLSDGETLRSICRDERMPSKTSVLRWATDIKHPLSDQYVRAREIGFLGMADETIDISDNASNDWMERLGKDEQSIGWQLNGDHIQRSKLRVETRKWLLSKCLPKIYGEKTTTELTGKNGGAIEIVTVDKMELARWIAFNLTQAAELAAPKMLSDAA